MIKGLYEAHLPVSDLDKSIKFYEGLGLQFDHRVDDKRGTANILTKIYAKPIFAM